jgi:hypothetical protein
MIIARIAEIQSFADPISRVRFIDEAAVVRSVG